MYLLCIFSVISRCVFMVFICWLIDTCWYETVCIIRLHVRRHKSCYVPMMLKPSIVAETEQTKQGGGAGTSSMGATAAAGSGLASNEQGLNIQNLQSILQNMGFSPQEQVGLDSKRRMLHSVLQQGQ